MIDNGHANLLETAGAPRGSLLEVDGLEVEFATDRGWVRVVDKVSLEVRPGEVVGIVGESGSGKTVTGLAIMGLIPKPNGRVSGGRIMLSGTNLLEVPERALRRLRGSTMSMIFQEPMTSLNPAFTVGDQISETVRAHRDCSRRTAWARAVEMLDLVGIPSAAKRARAYPHEFSGGMRQRVMIAMALSCSPELLIADEPTTALDVTVQAQILDLLLSLQAELGMAVLFVTHDLSVVSDICERVVVMYAGQVVERAGVDGLLDRPRHPYSEGLLRCMPDLDRPVDRLPTIPGMVPDLSALPSGCRFAARCAYTVDRCLTAPVALSPVAPERAARCVRVQELELNGVA